MTGAEREVEQDTPRVTLKSPTPSDRKELKNMFLRMFEEEAYTTSDGTGAYKKSIEDFYCDTEDKFGTGGQMLAWLRGRIAGFIWVLKIKHFLTGGDLGMIGSIYVYPHFRGQGVARELMKWAEEYGRKKSFEKMTLNVFSGNSGARKLYEGLGYVEISSTMEKNLED